jgi:hypothetical protein
MIKATISFCFDIFFLFVLLRIPYPKWFISRIVVVGTALDRFKIKLIFKDPNMEIYY